MSRSNKPTPGCTTDRKGSRGGQGSGDQDRIRHRRKDATSCEYGGKNVKELEDLHDRQETRRKANDGRPEKTAEGKETAWDGKETKDRQI